MLGKKKCNSRCELIGRKKVFLFYFFIFIFKSRAEEKFKWRKKIIENKWMM